MHFTIKIYLRTRYIDTYVFLTKGMCKIALPHNYKPPLSWNLPNIIPAKEKISVKIFLFDMISIIDISSDGKKAASKLNKNSMRITPNQSNNHKTIKHE